MVSKYAYYVITVLHISHYDMGGEGRAQAKAWALLDYAGHRPT